MLTDARSKLGRMRDESIEVTLGVGGQSYKFELERDGCGAFAVGSRTSADLRFDRPGVAPVHFHIERDDNRVWIVPAYGVSGIRVNATRITGPKVISGKAIIEFAAVRIRVLVIDYASGLAQDSSSDADTLGWNICTTQVAIGVAAAPGFEPTVPSNQALSKTLPLGALVAPVRVFAAPESKPISTIPIEPRIRAQRVLSIDAKKGCASSPASQTPLLTPVVVPSPLFGETTLFDPIADPVQPSELSLTPTSLVVSRHRTAKTPIAHLRQIGLLSQRRPRLVWLSGSSLIFVVFALVGWVSRQSRRADRFHAQATYTTSGPIRDSPPAIENAPDQRRSTPALEVVTSGPDSQPQVENEAQSVNRKLFAATDHLIAGHYADAQRAYANLATRPSADPAVIEIARLLTEKLGSRCAGEASNPVLSCPEIRQ
jgi:hypothetical protein